MDITELTSFLNTTFVPAPKLGLSNQLHWQPAVTMPAGVPASVESYAVILRTATARQAVHLGGWLATDDARLFAAAVEAMSPPLTRPAQQLLIEALIQVASEQISRRQSSALRLAGVAALVLSVILLLGSFAPDAQPVATA